MEKIFIIKNVDCQNCANKLEKFLVKELQLENVTINLAADKIILNGRNVSSSELEKAACKLEKDVKIYEINQVDDHDHEHQGQSYQLVQIILSLVLFILGLILNNSILFIVAYFIVGFSVLKMAVKNMIKRQFFDEFFLMSVATVAAISIGQLSEAVAVMIFYSIGEYMQAISLAKTKFEVKQLAKMRVRKVNLVTKNKIATVDPENVEVGSEICVYTAEQVGIDSVLLTKEATFDLSTLTGESVPVLKKSGDEIKAGSIALDQVNLKTIRREDESTIAKLVELVTYADANKTKSERFITKFAKVYTPIIVFLAISIVIFLPFFSQISLNEAIYRAVTLLVISCPCAFILSVPLGYVVAIGKLAKMSILVKGSNAIDKLAKIKLIASDKTGTLTTGEFEVVEFNNLSELSNEEIHELVHLGEKSSTHPIAKSLVKYTSEYEKKVHVKVNVLAGSGIEYEYNKKVITIKKGIDQTTATTNVELLIDQVVVAKYDLQDEIKSESIEFAKELRKQNIELLMLTGDNQNVAQYVANKLKITTKNVYANLMPNDKLEIVESKIKKGSLVAFVGDGINDAAVIRRSDVGIAMGLKGSGLAIESADIVISNDKINGIIKAIEVSKKTNKLMKQNICFAFIVKICFIILAIFGITTMWEAVFSDVGVTIIAIINAKR